MERSEWGGGGAAASCQLPHDNVMTLHLQLSTWLTRGLNIFSFFLQKSKEEKKKKKHKHEEKEEDLLGGQGEEPVVQSEEPKEVAAQPTSPSAEVCFYNMLEPGCFTPFYDQILEFVIKMA